MLNLERAKKTMPNTVENVSKDCTAMHRQDYYVSLTVHGRFGPNPYSKIGLWVRVRVIHFIQV